MEVIDREKAARVWQRVRGTGIPTDGGQSLRQLICEEQTDSAALQRLSYRFRGRQARLLRQLAEDERAHASCLKGILLQTEGSCPPINTVPPPLERTDSLLRRCCDRQQRRLKEYEARTTDPSFGHVYARLAAQEQAHCFMLLTILGRL